MIDAATHLHLPYQKEKKEIKLNFLFSVSFPCYAGPRIDYQMFADRAECGKCFERRGWQNAIRTIRRLFTAGENGD